MFILLNKNCCSLDSLLSGCSGNYWISSTNSFYYVLGLIKSCILGPINGEMRGVRSSCISEIISQGRSYDGVSVEISNCFFSRTSLFTGSGGVIYVLGGSRVMNISFSMFFNCSCTKFGGAIYFTSYDASLRMICANSCSASQFYVFAYICSTQKTSLEYISLSNCSKTTSELYSIFLHKGYQSVDNTNSSMNNAYQVSGISVDTPSSFSSSRCTFSNNNVYDSICISFSSCSGTMTFANIVHNNSPLLSGIVHVFGGSPSLQYCIFDGNQDTLFWVNSGSLEVSHCFISHSGLIINATLSLTSINNSLTKEQLYQIQFFNSYYCNTDVPRTPLITQTIEMTKKETPHNTPYRSLGEQTPSHAFTPIYSPAISSPFYTIEQTPMMSSEKQTENDDDQKLANFIFQYSAVIVSALLIVIICCILGFRRKDRSSQSNSSSPNLEENGFDNIINEVEPSI